MPLDQNPQKTVGRLFNVCVRIFCAPNATILLVYLPAEIKMSFIWKDGFFLPKSASSVSRSLAHLAKQSSSVYTTIFVRWKNKTNYLCQISYELSVTIHEISTSWRKKNVKWRILYKRFKHKRNNAMLINMMVETTLLNILKVKTDVDIEVIKRYLFATQNSLKVIIC